MTEFATETARLHGYSSPFNLGHKALENFWDGNIVVQEKIDGCAVPETLILFHDLTWRPVGEAVPGDVLIGLNYESIGLTHRMKLRPSIVMANIPLKKSCLRVITDMGETIITPDHPFWTRAITANNKSRWCAAENLRSGWKIAALKMWEIDQSYKAGYLAGFFDGEGSLVRHGKHQRVLSVTQRVGPCQQQLKDILIDLGFCLREDIRKREENWQEIWTGIIAGGWGEILRFLGQVRPNRLLERSEQIWEGGSVNGLPRATVLAIEPVGKKWISGLSTSTHTYFAGGLASHNSQFSFGVRDRQLLCRSRKVEINQLDPGMFALAVETAQRLRAAGLLTEGWTYRGEFLAKPKQNTLAYERVPAQNVVLFDIDRGLENYLPPVGNSDDLLTLPIQAESLGLECVPTYRIIFAPDKPTMDELKGFLANTSILGGPVEGIVLKNYGQFGPDKKVLMAKLVSAEFQETHRKNWAGRNPGEKDLIELIIEEYANPIRWKKAVQHCREFGTIQGAPQDIPILMKEIATDVGIEAMEEIQRRLFDHFWPKIRKGLTRGFPEFYKKLLLEESLGLSENET